MPGIFDVFSHIKVVALQGKDDHNEEITARMEKIFEELPSKQAQKGGEDSVFLEIQESTPKDGNKVFRCAAAVTKSGVSFEDATRQAHRLSSMLGKALVVFDHKIAPGAVQTFAITSLHDHPKRPAQNQGVTGVASRPSV